MCPYNKNNFCLAESPIHDSYLCFANISSFLCLYLSLRNKTQGLRANHKHNWNMHLSRSEVYQDSFVTMVPSSTLSFAARGTAGLSAAEGGIWVHRLTTAAYFPSDSRNIKSSSTPCSQTQLPPICSPSFTWQPRPFQGLDHHLQGSKFQPWNLRSLELVMLKHAHCYNCSAGPVNVLYYWLLTNI